MPAKKILLLTLAGLIILLICPILLAAKKPAPTSFDALVIKSDGSTLLVNAADEKHFKQLAVQTDDKTQVLIDGKPAALRDLKPGQRVIVSPTQGTAKQIEQKEPRRGRPVESGLMDGAVASVDGGRVLFLTPTSSGEITRVEATTGDKTVVIVDGKPASPGDLKAGQYIEIAFLGGNVRRIVVQPDEPR